MSGPRAVQTFIRTFGYLAACAPTRFLPAETSWLRTLGSIIAGSIGISAETSWQQYRAIVADRPGPARAANQVGLGR
jgi:hypothetical protein